MGLEAGWIRLGLAYSSLFCLALGLGWVGTYIPEFKYIWFDVCDDIIPIY